MKFAQIDIDGDGDVVTVQYAAGTEGNAPDLTGFIPALVPEMVAKLGYAHKPVVYLDSQGVWDEVVLHAGEFAGFRTLGVVTDREMAIKRALELRAMMDSLESTPAGRTALDLLTIFKDNDGKTRPKSMESDGPMDADEMLDKLASGITVAVQARAKKALNQILAAALDSVPPDKRAEIFTLLDKVNRDYDDVLLRMAPDIAGMVNALARGRPKADDVRKAAEEAKNASKH